MRKISIILFISFATVAVFGFLAVSGHGDSHFSGCISEALGKSGFCPENPFAYITFHLDILRTFSMVILLLPIILLLSIVLLYIGVGVEPGNKREPTVFSGFRREESRDFPIWRNVIRWFSILERKEYAPL